MPRKKLGNRRENERQKSVMKKSREDREEQKKQNVRIKKHLSYGILYFGLCFWLLY